MYNGQDDCMIVRFTETTTQN
jgi:nitrogen-specific signal transduction histidine kinase